MQGARCGRRTRGVAEFLVGHVLHSCRRCLSTRMSSPTVQHRGERTPDDAASGRRTTACIVLGEFRTERSPMYRLSQGFGVQGGPCTTGPGRSHTRAPRLTLAHWASRDALCSTTLFFFLAYFYSSTFW